MKLKIFLSMLLAASAYGFFTSDFSGGASSENYSNIYIANNYRVYPSSMPQSEPEIIVHPLNPNILFIGSLTVGTGGFKSEGVYVTTNGGDTWFGSDSCKGNPIFNHGGDPGPAIDKDGRFFMSHIGKVQDGQFAHYSTDMGVTWSNQYPIFTGELVGKGDIRSDISAVSPYYGKTYLAWVKFSNPFPVLISSTTNGGVNWSAPFQTNNPPQRCQGAIVRMNTAGDLLLCWAGVSSSSPFTENYIGFSKSTNGGQSFSVNENVYPMNGINGTLPQKSNIVVNGLPDMEIDLSGGPKNGWIYICTGEKNHAPAGTDPDVVFHRSTDGGTTWSPGVRVNQDALNNGKIQYFPAITVDNGGGINIIYYDDRRTTSDSAEVFMSRSTDGGFTWKDFPISDHKFKPSPIVGGGTGYQGDNISITSVGNYLWPTWMDNSSGIYQIWASKIDINTIGIQQISSNVPDKFTLEQNYPNPFNPSTNIKFSIKEKTNVSMKIYNTEGKLIETLVERILPSGEYEYTFEANNLNSGIYFVTLQTAGYSDTKKMILLK